jgi:hypothetical protein
MAPGRRRIVLRADKSGTRTEESSQPGQCGGPDTALEEITNLAIAPDSGPLMAISTLKSACGHGFVDRFSVAL